MNKLKTFIVLFVLCLAITASAEDGSRLWLRHEMPKDITLKIDPTMPDDDGYRISGRTVTARTEMGLLYGRYALLRGEQGESHPYYKLRILNHWDNIDGSIERGYAGKSIFWNNRLEIDHNLIEKYAEANASVGINGTVLNNVNASPKMLTRAYINKVKEVADILRPWGIKVYISVNFGSPKALGELKTADPLNPQVRRWWQKKAKEIYAAIPDFGGFLVKANSEGQPGPFDYGRTHADGANMLADALKPFGGIVMWRSFVYGAKHQGEDRVKQAVSEFAELDGQFRDNVILQSKNGPLDFQPREPYAPIFDQMKKTPQMAELQITQEYHVEGVLLLCQPQDSGRHCRRGQHRTRHQLVRSSFLSGQLVCFRPSGMEPHALVEGDCRGVAEADFRHQRCPSGEHDAAQSRGLR